MITSVLHDWDNPHLSGRYALGRGCKLILYALSRKIKILQSLDSVKVISDEVRSYADTLAKLNALIGINSIFGILDRASEVYPDARAELKEDFNVDVRKHIHIGEAGDPNRIRTWDPIDGLEGITSRIWHFDEQYAKGNPIELLPGELGSFHVDYPQYLTLYIDWLYQSSLGRPHNEA